MSDLWPVVLGGAITLMGTFAATRAEDGRSRRLEASQLAREASARTAEDESAAAAFQRDTLLDLQDALHRLARAAGAAHHETNMAFGAGGEWGRQPLGTELDEGFAEAIRDVHRLRVRIADDDVRSGSKRLTDLASASAMPAMREEEVPHHEARALATDAFREAISIHDLVNERIGELLRTT